MRTQLRRRQRSIQTDQKNLRKCRPNSTPIGYGESRRDLRRVLLQRSVSPPMYFNSVMCRLPLEKDHVTVPVTDLTYHLYSIHSTQGGDYLVKQRRTKKNWPGS